jgi:hypothetical protein
MHWHLSGYSLLLEYLTWQELLPGQPQLLGHQTLVRQYPRLSDWKYVPRNLLDPCLGVNNEEGSQPCFPPIGGAMVAAELFSPNFLPPTVAAGLMLLPTNAAYRQK